MRLLLLIVLFCSGITALNDSKNAEPSIRQSQNRPTIAIIGAGIAGMSAARRLAEMGHHDVDVYEGMTRYGGRIHPVAYHGGYLQMGAQFINGNKNPLYDIANKLDVIDSVVSDFAHLEQAEYLLGNQNINREDIDLFMDFVEPLDPKYRELAKNHDLLARVYSIKTIFMEDYNNFIRKNKISGARRAVFDALTRTYRSYWEFEWASSWDDLSPRILKDFREYEADSAGESYITNKVGFKAIIDYMRNQIPDNQIHFNVTITNIRYDYEQVVLTSLDGELAKKYDYVIVTSSLGHLKKFHHTLFTPKLPRSKRNVIDKIGFGGSCKVFFRWDKPFWKNGTYSIAPLPVAGMARDTVDAFEQEMTTLQVVDWEPNTLMGWVAGEGHKIIDDMSDEEIITRMTRLIRDMKNDQTIEPPSELVRTQLTHNDLLLGSYSYVSKEQAMAGIDHAQLAIPVKHNGKLRVLFAGEATHHRLFQTTVGAYLSGRREVDRAINDWARRPNTTTPVLPLHVMPCTYANTPALGLDPIVNTIKH